MSQAPLVDQPSKKPTRKVTLGTLGGASLAPVIVWAFAQFGLEVPLEVAAAIGGLLAGLVAYLVRDRA